MKGQGLRHHRPAEPFLLRVFFRLQLWVPNVVKNWSRHEGNASRSKKKGCDMICKNKCHHRDNVGQIFLQKKCSFTHCVLFFCPEKNRRRSETLCPPSSFFAHVAKRNSGTTSLPHVVTSVQLLFPYFAAPTLEPVVFCQTENKKEKRPRRYVTQD